MTQDGSPILLATLGHPKDQVAHLERQRRAYLGFINWETKSLFREITYNSPDSHMSARFPRFAGGSFYGDKYYTCTPTEIVVYDVPA